MNNQLEELKKQLDEIQHKISEIETAKKDKQRNNCLIKPPG